MVGTRIGNYLIRREIGCGGMGVVYEAWHEQLGRRAAVKVLLPKYAEDREVAARFLNEARAVNIIQHPGVVSAFDFGRTEAGAPYIVMDFLDGVSLRQRLRQLAALGGRFSLGKAVRLAHNLAAALAAAHTRQIVHRDLKPDNRSAACALARILPHAAEQAHGTPCCLALRRASDGALTIRGRWLLMAAPWSA